MVYYQWSRRDTTLEVNDARINCCYQKQCIFEDSKKRRKI
jgi:hypothetical protein